MKITILLACLVGMAAGGAAEVAAQPCAGGRCALRSCGAPASSPRAARRQPLRNLARRLLCRRNC